MMLPTRQEFLSTGLVPIKASDSKEHIEDCGICMSSAENTVKLSCGHQFDDECIRHWLEMPSRNTCPLCRSKLFRLTQEEQFTIETPDETPGRVVQAMRNSGLFSHSVDNVQTYGSNLFTLAELRRATAHAMSFVHEGTSENPLAAGPALITARSLSASFVAMANFLPAFAAVSGRVHDDQHSDNWKLLMRTLWTVIEPHDNKRYNALALSRTLRRDVEDEIKNSHPGAEQMDFLSRVDEESENSDLTASYNDFELMLNYLTFVCWTARRYEQSIDVERRNGGRHRLSMLEHRRDARCDIM